MKIETDKDMVCVNKIVEQKQETVFVEGDVIIPDVKPDIISSVSTSGNICIYKKELLDGKVRIDGSINTYIVYLAEGESSSVRGLNASLDFTQVLEVPNVKVGMDLELQVDLKSVECKILNGRKINVKSCVDFRAKVYSNENIQIVKNITKLESVQMLNRNLSINSLVGVGNTRTCGKDTLVMESTDQLAEILSVSVRIMNEDQKISYNKVLAKADANVKILYLTEDNRICSVQGMVPIMGFIDIQNVAETNICDIKYMMKNVIIKPNDAQEHSIYIEIDMELNCHVYETKQINLVQDAYSPECDISFTKKTVNTMMGMRKVVNTYNLREQLPAGNIGKNRIYDVQIRSMLNSSTATNETIMYEGEVALNVLFASETVGRLEMKSYRVPFTFNTPVEGCSNNCNCETQIDVRNDNFILMPDGTIDVKMDLNFNTSITRNAEITMIDQMEMEENRDMVTYSMVIYFVKPNDTLWNIAKRFRSTVEDIVRVNKIEDANKIYPGEQLFIPRYVARRNMETA